MIKVVILIPLWKRPDIVKFTVSKLKKTILESKMELTPLFILSTEDPNYLELLDIISDFRFCEFKNYPLGAKMNAGVRTSLLLEYDYLMNFGSDDVIEARYFDEIMQFCKAKEEVIGLNSCKIVDYRTKKRYYLVNVCKEYPIGAGRMIHRSVIERIIVDEKTTLYSNEINSGLDGNSIRRIVSITGNEPYIIETQNSPITDYKSNTNINPIPIIWQHLTTTEN